MRTRLRTLMFRLSCSYGLLAASLVATSAAQASPALPVSDVAGGPALYEVFNALSGNSLANSAELAAWAGPDDSGAWDGELWHGGMGSVAIAISTSAGNANYFGLYRDTETGDAKLTLYGSVSGNEMLGPVFDAEYLFHDVASVQDVGFWLSSAGPRGQNTFHGRSELDHGSSFDRAASRARHHRPSFDFGHLASFHFGQTVSVHTDEGDLELRNAHLLAWEDWTDADYDDLIFLVGETGADPVPIPEPGTGLLLAAGVVACLAPRRGGRSARRA